MFNTSKLAASIHSTAPAVSPTEAELRKAAAYYADRPNNAFCQDKDMICLDLASKLARFGSYASEKQQQYAAKLVEWSKPRVTSLPEAKKIYAPKLFDVMQRHAHLYVDPLKLSRKNQDSLVWIMYRDTCVGKIEAGVVSYFYKRLGDNAVEVQKLIAEFEADPLAAAKKYGKLAGRCCSCGRDLTNEGSIEAGIGPICATKFG